MMLRLKHASALFVGLVGLVGCSSSPQQAGSETKPTVGDVTKTEPTKPGTETETTKGGETKTDAKTSPTGEPATAGKDTPESVVAALKDGEKADRAKIKIEVLKKGSGAVAVPGDTVFMEYTGALTDGKVFDSNAGGNKEPLTFQLGTGKVIRGWDLGLIGMETGEERKLTIPSELGYGAAGSGSTIPGNSTLVFTVKLLGTLKAEDATIYDISTKTPGSGAKATKDSEVTFGLVIHLLNGKEVFNTSGKPLKLKLSDTQTGYSPGLLSALSDCQAGGKYEVRMPPLIAGGLESKNVPPDPFTQGLAQVLMYTITVESVK